MAYSAYAVANAFVKRALEGRLPDLSPMKLQKLMYFAQAWYIKVRGVPLMDDHFSRWQHGPVIPAIYHEFKAYGWHNITRMATTLAWGENGYSANVPTVPEQDTDTWQLIDAIINHYGEYDATSLSEMTHAPESAWALKRGDGSVITMEEIKGDRTI